MAFKEFPCGCKIEIVNGKYDLRFDKIDLLCPATWDIFKSGKTKGVFQLERQGFMSSKVEPTCLEHLSDLVAIIRPGCKNSFIDGKSLTDHYVERKAGREPVEYLDEALREILQNTQGILTYQEQALQIAAKIAGFSLSEADTLRKAIGKKKADVMAEMKIKFLEGSENTGIVSKSQAEEIFSWIEASQRYSFNKSHSVAYAANAYQTAYCKAHFPRSFYTTYLRYASSKIDTFEEIAELIEDAKEAGIDVNPPDVRHLNGQFELIDNKPTFGLQEIKGIGKSVYDKMMVGIKEQGIIDINEIQWHAFLALMIKYIKSNSFESLILSGALDCMGHTRNSMLHDFKVFKNIRDRELPYIQNYLKENPDETITNAIHNMMLNNDMEDKKRPIFREARYEALLEIIDAFANPGYKLNDPIEWKAIKEKNLLGISMTCAKSDGYDNSGSNMSCSDFLKNNLSTNGVHIVAELLEKREYAIKGGTHKGELMLFMKIQDSSAVLDNVVMFTDQYTKYKDVLMTESVFLFSGSKDDRGSFKVEKVQEVS